MNFKLNISKNYILVASIGLIYLWFGTLKFFPNHSPAASLAENTIAVLTFHLIPAKLSLLLLAIWESMVGILLITAKFKRIAISFAIIHMVFTFAPLFLFPEQMFVQVPFELTILGQYVIKNIVIIFALCCLYNLPTPKPSLVKKNNSIS